MTSTTIDALDDDVAAASAVVAPSWPLSSTIAVNPLSGFEHLPFADALTEAGNRFGARGHLSAHEFGGALRSGRITRSELEAAIDRRYPGLGVDERETRLAEVLHDTDTPLPRRQTLTRAERADRASGSSHRETLDRELTEWCAQWSTRAQPGNFWSGWRSEHRHADTWDADPALALAEALERLSVQAPERRGYLESHLSALPGWSAHLRWRTEQFNDDTLLGFLAAAISREAELVGANSQWEPVGADPTAGRGEGLGSTPLGPTDRAVIWLDAYERVAHDALLGTIDRVGNEFDATAEPVRPRAQIVCCIDVRSEGVRRQLESVGPYETYGYAGFFGLAARFEPVSGGVGTDQCPVLLRPGVTLREEETPTDLDRRISEIERQRTAIAFDDAWRATKYHPIAPLALAEAAGWVAGPIAALRTAAPGFTAWAADQARRVGHRPFATEYDRGAIDPDDQADLVGAILRLGLRPHVARMVVLCGHGARVDNNPTESGLACGACGGNSGAANARAVAAMANDPTVRNRLAARGTPIPDDTWFIAALHDTATDTVSFLDVASVPASHSSDLQIITHDCDVAGRLAAEDRASALPGLSETSAKHTPRDRNRIVRKVRRRSRDWAEPAAELGLAGNMAFLVGPRHLTRGADLSRRVFLHSYDAASDRNGQVLNGILTAPLIVAQWINAQYNFSTTDPEIFGAGTKAVHNVLGDVGLLRGPGGDLCRGLPVQSVRSGSTLLHEPIRLMAVVQGSLDHIDASIAGSVTLRQLVENEWIAMVARATPDAPWQQRTASGWHERTIIDRSKREPSEATS